MVTMDNYRYFVEIAKDMNLGVTAGRMYITQQGLSGHIRRLETHYGVKLVKRSPVFSLTEDGKKLLSEAKKMLSLEDSLREYFGGLGDRTEGTIRVACAYNRLRMQMTGVISQFSELYPRVLVEVIDTNSAGAYRLLANGGAELCVSNLPSDVPPDAVTHELARNYGYVLLSRELLRSCLGEELEPFLKRCAHGMELCDIPDGVTILQPYKDGERWWLLEFFPELESMPHKFVSMTTAEITLALCKNSKGAVIVSGLYLDSIFKTYSQSYLEGLYFIPLFRRGERFCTVERVTYRTDRRKPEYFREFLRILESKFQELLPEDNEKFSKL